MKRCFQVLCVHLINEAIQSPFLEELVKPRLTPRFDNRRTLDPYEKSKLELYFEQQIPEEYESFYLWMREQVNEYHSEEPDIPEFLSDTYQRKHANSTPFPIPENGLDLYRSLMYQKTRKEFMNKNLYGDEDEDDDEEVNVLDDLLNRRKRQAPALTSPIDAESTTLSNLTLSTSNKTFVWITIPRPTTSKDSIEIYREYFKQEDVQPAYKEFYKWYRSYLIQSKKSPHKILQQIINDHTFLPLKRITNTQFPIPSVYRKLYQWLLRQKDVVQPDGRGFIKVLERHFAENIDPSFEPFYKWLYKELDYGNFSLYKKMNKWIWDSDFTLQAEITSTPFPVPLKYQPMFEYERWDVSHKDRPNTTRFFWSSITSTTTPTTTPLPAEVSLFFTDEPPNDVKEYPDFYKFYYKESQNGSEDPRFMLKNYIMDRKRFVTPLEYKRGTFPFPVPKVYQRWYHWLVWRKINPKPIRTTRLDAQVKAKLQKVFNHTIPTHYADFYRWLYKALNNGTVRLYRKWNEWIWDDDFVPDPKPTNTPFPIPPKFDYLYQWILSNRTTTTHTPKNLYEYASPDKKNQLNATLTSPLTESVPPTSTITAGKRVKRHVQSTPNHNLMNEIRKHFPDETIQPEHEQFYQWYLKLLNNIQLSPEKIMAKVLDDHTFEPQDLQSTPFPIPSDFKNLYQWLSLQKDVFPPGEDELKKKLEVHFKNQFEHQYLPFFSWLYRKLDNGTKSLDDFEFRLANTPFPIPKGYENIYQWIISNDTTITHIPNINHRNDATLKTTEGQRVKRDLQPMLHSVDLMDNMLECFFTKSATHCEDFTLTYTSNQALAPKLALTPFLKLTSQLTHFFQYNMSNWVRYYKEKINEKLLDSAFAIITPKYSLFSTTFSVPKLTDLLYQLYHNPWHLHHATKSTTETLKRCKRDIDSVNPDIQPQYEEFYRWLYKYLDYGRETLFKKLNEMNKDLAFQPQGLHSTPFPIPSRFRLLYEWVVSPRRNTSYSTLQHTTNSDQLNRQIESFFNEVIQPQFQHFYRWFYRLFTDNKDSFYNRFKKWILTHNFPLNQTTRSTPFPIPSKYQAAYQWVVKRNQSKYITSDKPKLHQISPDYGPFMNTVRNFFTDEQIDIQHEEYYKWLFKQFEFGKDSARQKLLSDFKKGYTLIMPQHTPFPVPQKDLKLFEYLAQRLRSSTHVDFRHKKYSDFTFYKTSINTRSSVTLDPEKYRDNVENYFGRSIEPYHLAFFFWLFEALRKDGEKYSHIIRRFLKQRKYVAVESSTPFPIPESHMHLYSWLLAEPSLRRIGKPGPDGEIVTMQTVFRSEEDMQYIANFLSRKIPRKYEQFYHWLFHVQWDQGGFIARQFKASEMTEEFQIQNFTDTPYPIPRKYQTYFAYVNFMDHVLSSTRHHYWRRTTFSMKPIEEYFSTTIKHNYVNFFRWVYERFDSGKVPFYEKIANMMLDTTFQPLKRRATAFSVPTKYVHLHDWLKIREAKDKSTTQDAKVD